MNCLEEHMFLLPKRSDPTMLHIVITTIFKLFANGTKSLVEPEKVNRGIYLNKFMFDDKSKVYRVNLSHGRNC